MIKKLSGNSIRLGRFSRMVGCSLILILLLAGVGMSQAVAPAAEAASAAALCPDEYHVESSAWEGEVFVSQLSVHFMNYGPGDAYNVIATISSVPANTVATDPVAELGDIANQGGAWSDTYELRVNMSNPQDPDETITWKVEYDDADGVHRVIEGVPQFCDGGEIPPIPGEPEPPVTAELKIKIKQMTVQWSREDFRWRWPREDTFSIWGRLQLPDGYSLADLEKKIKVSIAIGGSSGNDEVELQERNLSRLGLRWTYRGDELPSGGGMNIKNVVLWWAPDGSRWAGQAGFYIGGILELPEYIGCNTQPTALVTLEIPATGGSLVGDDTITYKSSPRLFRWTYKAKLPRFQFDP